MIDTGQVIIGIVVLLVVVGALVYIFYSRTNAVEKTGYGALIMLSIVSLMIPVFWIMETNGQTQAKIQQHNIAVQQGAALYAKYCFSCHGLSGQGGSGPKLNGNEAVNKLSDNDLMRIISAGIPDANDPTKLLMPSWGEQYGGPLSQPQIQYLFELVRSADPAYLKTNGFASGTDVNGFNKVPDEVKASNPTQYKTAVAQATSAAGTGQFGAPVDMTNKTEVTINIINPPANATCTPACFEVANIKVKVGTKITWLNQSSTPHTVTAIEGTDPGKLNPDPNLFDSGATSLIMTDGKFSYTVTEEAYNADPKGHQIIYFCRIHPGMLAMITIVP